MPKDSVSILVVSDYHEKKIKVCTSLIVAPDQAILGETSGLKPAVAGPRKT